MKDNIGKLKKCNNYFISFMLKLPKFKGKVKE